MKDFSKIDPSLRRIAKNLKGEKVTTSRTNPAEHETHDGKWAIETMADRMPRHAMFPKDFLALPDWE